MVRLLEDIDELPPGLRFVATVGVFDGVHLGHVHVLEALSRQAAELGAAAVAITFEPHPQAVVTGRAPDLICDPDEKLARMADAGAELVVVQRFDEAFRAQTAEEFLERLAYGRDLAGLVMSHESAFGRDRQGTVDTVQRLAARDGWQLVEIDTLEVDGAPVSSSRVRAAVGAGDLAVAERLLGRRYAITGAAEAVGDGWWSLEPAAPYAMPPAGSYAVKASWTPKAGPNAVDAPLSPGAVEHGMAVIDAVGSVRCSLLGAAAAPSDERVRVQWVDTLASDVVTTADPELARALAAAREGCVYLVMNPELVSPETSGERGPVAEVWHLAAEVGPGEAHANRTADGGSVGGPSTPTIGQAWFTGCWSLSGEPAGLEQPDVYRWTKLEAAVSWARAHASQVHLLLPDRWPPSGGDDRASWHPYSAGDEPIPGLPEWDGREP